MSDHGFFDQLRINIENWLVEIGFTKPPVSSVALVLVSILVSSFSGIVTRLVLDVEKLQRDSEMMREHQLNKRKAMAEGDKKLWIRVKRNEERFLELQQSTMMNRTLPSLITWVPIIFVFTTLRETFQFQTNLDLNGDPDCVNSCGGLVVLPFGVNESTPIFGSWFSPYSGDLSLSIAGFGFWYFLSAIITSTVLMRIFGINLTGIRNPQSNMGM